MKFTGRKIQLQTDASKHIQVGQLFFKSGLISKLVFFIISFPTDTMKYITHLDMEADLWKTTCMEHFDVKRQISKGRKLILCF